LKNLSSQEELNAPEWPGSSARIEKVMYDRRYRG
jgi:hypothetical protein